MIRAPLAKIFSLVIAAGLVTGAAQLALPRQTLQIEGGGTPIPARMGSRFEDMAVGTLTALTTQDTTPSVLQPVAAERVRDFTETVPVTAPATLAPAPASLAPAVLPALQAATAAPPPQALLAQEPDSDAPTLSQRPLRKNPELAAKFAAQQARDLTEQAQKRAAAKKAETRKTASDRKPAQKAPRGNAKRNNTQGAESGTSRTEKAKTTGTRTQKASTAGNAAVSTYPGQVMRKISRAGKPRVRAKGTAVIAFSVSTSGGLASVSVARSSGSAALDQAAVGLIRKAAPFPRPPAGAQRRFTIRIKGR